MLKILLASHGIFAKGVKNALELILGNQQNVYTMCAYVDENNDVKSEVKSFFDSVSPEDDWIVVTDIFGGSVNNEFMEYLAKKKFQLITGMSLPLLVELVTNPYTTAEELVKTALTLASGEMKHCNPLIAKATEQAEDDF